MKYEGRSLTVYHAASGGPRADAHAGYRETSLMLHLTPDSVHQDLLAAGSVAPFAQVVPRLRELGVRAVSENGVLGDPTGANAEEGRTIFSAMSRAAVAIAGRLLESAPPIG
jgi:creatinine amidohydrolase